MTRRALVRLTPLAALAATLGLLMGPSADARTRWSKLRTKQLKQLTLEFTKTKPTLYPAKPARLMDRGRLALLGPGLWDEHHHFEFLDTKTLTQLRVQAPLPAYIKAHARQFPRKRKRMRSGKLSIQPPYKVEKLLYYDRTAGAAGLWVDDDTYNVGGRYLYAHWDLKARRITRTYIIATKEAARSDSLAKLNSTSKSFNSVSAALACEPVGVSGTENSLASKTPNMPVAGS